MFKHVFFKFFFFIRRFVIKFARVNKCQCERKEIVIIGKLPVDVTTHTQSHDAHVAMKLSHDLIQ